MNNSKEAHTFQSRLQTDADTKDAGRKLPAFPLFRSKDDDNVWASLKLLILRVAPVDPPVSTV